jgi:predicted rRNA methylase YqxC with S4 and FtsJ domains
MMFGHIETLDERLDELVNLLVMDVSFISLRALLPVQRGWLAEEADLIVLIKPQYEAGKCSAHRQCSWSSGCIYQNARCFAEDHIKGQGGYRARL